MNALSALRAGVAKYPLATAVAFLLVGTTIGMLVKGDDGSPRTEPRGEMLAHVSHSGDAATMWTCAMHPQIRRLEPGQCPSCGMDLIPVTASSGGIRTLAISPETRALMNIAAAPVERKYVVHEIPMVGKVDYDQTKFGQISAWVPGRLDRLYVDYAGVQVQQGDHMVYIYSPALYSAQEELIQALRYQTNRQNSTRSTPSLDLVEDAREKLRLLGLADEQIAEIQAQSRPSDHLTINSPVSGVVIEKLKQEGDYVQTGERIYTVADLNQVWVHLDAYESDLPWVRYGQDVTITTEALPGDEFHGRISFIQPVLDDKTRTVKVRVNVPNADGKLKPEMFVHAVVRPQVAAGGRVMDASLAGKWISPMHPEIVKDEPGKCDICGMPLVRAESLGFVTPDIDQLQPPLVIPNTAALVTGRRAIVYVELPEMPLGVETAYQGISTSLETQDIEQVRQAFGVFSQVLDRPYDQNSTELARQAWDRYANQLATPTLDGKRAQTKEEAAEAFSRVDAIISELREQFGPVGQPTFEGREIVLGPRADDYYLVRHGLQEGEIVVTQGNFKIDAEIQIQAKPSMMTPEGGGGGGHDHGGGATMAKTDEHAGHMTLPADFQQQLRDLDAAYDQVASAVENAELDATVAAFAAYRNALNAVDGSLLTGHPRMQWQELDMLLGNDAVEGADLEEKSDMDRVYVSLKGHMRQLREQMGVAAAETPTHVEQLAASPEFQAELATVWQRYLAIQSHLAADNPEGATQSLMGLQSAVASVDDSTLSGRATEVWQKEQDNLQKIIGALQAAANIDAVRSEFKPLSEEIGVLARSFGFGEAGQVFELHCPMAFQGQGALWYQDDDQVRNPYYGASMLTCADRVERIVRDEPTTSTDDDSHQNHSLH